ncbi:sugar transferase [Aeromicrobium sp. Root495]|uniref:sugar transferase n=1 Tax=Aeromicrobium sp. Root495 TaxID=1736550 RepID=UPI0009E8A80F|nr:sugar transferase [Aeromicrobium sp. Root495]
MMKKRLLDLVLTVVGALVWVPVVLLVGLAIAITSGRPVLYRSVRRISRDEERRIVKFRTMIKNADKIANRDTVPVEKQQRFLNIAPDSPLYTPVGRKVERFALTELPQFLHILRGHMSIVGNRPLPENVMACLREEYPHADDRFLTPAGLTGPAQLVGRDALTDDERLTLEGAYCRAALTGYTFRLDLAILFATIFGVLGITKGLDYNGVIELIERHTRRARVTADAFEPAPALTRTEFGDAVPDGYADVDSNIA